MTGLTEIDMDVRPKLRDETFPGVVDRFWSFPACEVVKLNDGRIFALLAFIDEHVMSVHSAELKPKAGRDADDVELKLDDGADPTVYDIAECGIVTWENAEMMMESVGGSIL